MPAQHIARTNVHDCQPDTGSCENPAARVAVDVYTHGVIEQPLCQKHMADRVHDRIRRTPSKSWQYLLVKPIDAPAEPPRFPDQAVPHIHSRRHTFAGVLA